MSDTEKNNSIEEQIIQATIRCIEKDGIHNITTRSIAKEADVNSASINYYFRSKDKLIERVLERTLDEAFVINIEEEFGSDSNSIEESLVKYLTINLWGGFAYPNLMKAHFSDQHKDNSIKRIIQFLTFLEDQIKTIKQDTDEESIKMTTIQIMSVVMLSGFAPEMFKEYLNIDTANQEDLGKYVKHLLDHYLK